ncbi:MAG: hypothetical protein K8H85_15065 [Cyclobacteriaceae bacterium]|nr:hypothetical protein [Cyclobacteriaceae bacterium]
MIQLFEYGQWEKVVSRDDLSNLLIQIWKQRLFVPGDIRERADSRYQPFLKFDGDLIRARNYVGFIQTESDFVEIYPKVFDGKTKDKQLMLQHIFYWFSYCRKWRFPFNQASLDIKEIASFPELIIHLMANQFLETVTQQPLMQYQELSESMLTPRGSINFGRYVSNSLSRGNFHQIECDYEPFLFDNKVNRIIKYCARLLMDQTQHTENQTLLQEVIFVLDEVEDVYITAHDVKSVQLNSFFVDYAMLMEMCGIVINQQLYSNHQYDMSQWCLLFPMEYIFEDFVAGFLEQHFSDQWKVKYQKSDMTLVSKPEVFTMQHDIFLTSRDGSNRQIIVDTKYKVRQIEEDGKAGVSQSDLYQVVSYAYRRGCTEVILIYPNKDEALLPPEVFEIESGFAGKDIIKVKVVEVPFWSVDNFEGLETKLNYQLKEILK